MSRSSSNTENGILSVIGAAEIAGVSTPTIRRWFDKGNFPGSFRLPGSDERRIPAPGLLTFMVRTGMQIPPALRTLAAANEKAFPRPEEPAQQNNATQRAS
jgi:hypothetical protein